MAYDGRVLRRAREHFEADRDARRAAFDEQREAMFRLNPRLREVDSRLRSTASRILSAALRKGTDPLPAVAALREENLRLQKEKRDILSALRLPEDCLDEKPACPLCDDSGYRNGQMCRCLRAYYAAEQQKELSRMLDLGNQRFETFSLDWYPDEYNPALGISPRENMRMVYEACAAYARDFDEHAGNLLLFGGPGLGKTFLSAAMARVVSGNGFSVVYDTAERVFGRFEARKFAREEAAEDDVARVLSCDLLILDDLGTEMTTDFVRSALYQIVNTRLMEKLATVLNTNLTPAQIGERYSPQTASRLEGEYLLLKFMGEDIRKLRKRRKMGL